MIPKNPKTLSRQVALLAASHQIRMSRPHNVGPNTAAIQYFAAPSSNRPGPNRAPSIRATSVTAGQVRNGRKLRGGALSVGVGAMVSPGFAVGSFMIP